MHATSRRIDPMRLMLWLILPFLFFVVMISTTQDQPDAIAKQHYLISPEALRSRSNRIMQQQTRKKRNILRSRLGSPDHDRQAHTRAHDDAKKRDGISVEKSLPDVAETLPPVHNHVIPNTIIFTHSINLLETVNPSGEDVALKANVQNTIKLHPGAHVLFLTDDDCLASIARVMGADSPLLDFFRKESHGMYKADICRGAALYEHGGLYFDVDMQARMTLWSAVKPDSTFVVPFVHRDSKHPGNFFQAFIGAIPKNPIMKRYLELFIDHYQGKIDLPGPLGVLLLRKAHDEVVGTSRHPHVSDQVPQYFMEILYDKKLFPDILPPTWGLRRACRFVVVANTKAPYIVPFYSRVKGSRMCGGLDSENHS